MKRTPRGFGIYAEFVDSYGNSIRVQESSNIDRAVWIFTHYPDGTSAKEHLGELVSPSPHLTPTQARRVAKALLRFAEGK